MLRKEVFEKVQKSGKKILVVTKYHDREKTKDIIEEVEKNYGDICLGFGENRIESIIEKNIPRKKIHFIGKLQSKKISKIVEYCSVIHSLESIKHAQKIELCELGVDVFVQIQLDPLKDTGISANQLGDFLLRCKDFKYIRVIGISAIGAGDFKIYEKQEEFQKLILLRDTYIPEGRISAGTSRDYEIAIDKGIDIVRVGEKILTDI